MYIKIKLSVPGTELEFGTIHMFLLDSRDGRDMMIFKHNILSVMYMTKQPHSY